MQILHFNYLCIWTSDTLGNVVFNVLGWPIWNFVDQICIHVCVYAYLCFCVFVFACQTTGNIDFEVIVPLHFWKYMYHIVGIDHIVGLCNCVFAYMYLHVRQMGTLFEVLIPFQTSQELQMLSSVTLNCQATKIVMESGSQLSEL